MRLLKYICIALILASPVGAFEAGDKIEVSIVCLKEDAIMKWVMADLKSLDTVKKEIYKSRSTGECIFLNEVFKAYITQVIMDYKDYKGNDSQVLKIKLNHPITGQLSNQNFYIIGLAQQGI